MSDSVVTANESDGWHRGRAILSAANEDHIAFNNDHVKHDMNDDPKESENSAEATGEEHLDRDTVNDDADIVETANKLVGGIVDVLYSAQRTKKTISQSSTTILSSTIQTTAWKEIKHNQEEVKAHPQKPRRLSPWRLQGCQVMNIPIETQRKWKQIVSRAMRITLGSRTWSLWQVLSCCVSATA